MAKPIPVEGAGYDRGAFVVVYCMFHFMVLRVGCLRLQTGSNSDPLVKRLQQYSRDFFVIRSSICKSLLRFMNK